ISDEGARIIVPGAAPRTDWRSSVQSGTEAGTAHHVFLEHVRLDRVGDRSQLEAEARRLESEGVLSAEAAAAIDFDASAAFWGSELGREISARARMTRRELAFTARFSPAEIAEITGEPLQPGLENETIIVQGVADLVVIMPEELW